MTQNKIDASFCLFCYNQENFILDALEGTLNQEYNNMEIIISDDCSTDNTFNLILSRIKNYSGPHKIILNRNEVNLGLVPHLNKVVFELAHADILIFAAGDDISMPNRTKETIELFMNSPQTIQVTSSKKIINEQSQFIISNKIVGKNQKYNINNLLKSKSFMLGGGASAYRREVFSFFGKLNVDCPTEDSTLRNRSLLLGEILETSNIWYHYRVHNNSLSSISNIFKLNSELIANQYLVDIERAFNKNIISLKIYLRLKSKVKSYVVIQKCRKEISLTNNLLIKKYLMFKLMLIYKFNSIYNYKFNNEIN